MTSSPAAAGGPRCLIRAAGQLASAIARPARAAYTLADPVEQLLGRQELLRRRWLLLRAAERRGWSLAAAKLQGELLREAGHVRDRAADLSRLPDVPESPLPTDLLRTLLGELRQ